ncbi:MULTISPECIES: 5-methyltetrahydropteroyltriglutamate--homocysteine S-methyltransferase [Paenibacillus]|uniref:5-methyltetrahydropteroyltriglutamate--homocysteine S-methyltransferase n=1 Tax=Paenibacillus validus TaxID=44253 RepID=A0A7X3CVZ7_9BACL|nr:MULTISPECIES: 5-methyltetrahydropteroyltriglutamate--homocysteine S-methyltransferase [Paenibacillus]MUG73614.1 5-methyltetrahydropteroyltriglutamate--homocysteine S-methyltransferase [Paenibacillus validus]
MSIVIESAKQRTATPFRHDMVGSFLRPHALKEARIQFQNNEISADVLKKIEDQEIIKLVKKQKSVGLQAVTDGEFRRSWWHLDFMWGLDGVEKANLEKGYPFQGMETRAETARLYGKIGFSYHPFVEHFKFLKNVAGSDVIARQTIPAPAQFLAELQRPENKASTDAFYSSTEDLAADIAKTYKAAILAFYEAGCRSLQLDDCTWGMLCDKNYWESRQQEGVNVSEIAQLYARVNEEAIAGLPDDLIITTHVCRGNYHSTWASSGGYEPVAETLFGIDNIDAYYLEFDTDRAGDFAPLRYLKNQQVVLGLHSSKVGELEDREVIISRIREAAQYVDINHICLSPQCGFASTEEGNLLTEEQQWNKLALIKEIADEIWK